jgi:hypothetical protein
MPTPLSRVYNNFKGVDFANDLVALYRSPDSLNVWKNYRSNNVLGVETRPGMTLKAEFPSGIFGLFFYKPGDTEIVVVHSGTKLYTWNNYPAMPVFEGTPTVTEIYTGMNPTYSVVFIHNNILFIKDGINYLEFNGETCKAVEGTIPITANNRTPAGVSYDSEGNPDPELYQRVNLLQPKQKNAFIGDGTSTHYYLNTRDLDSAATFVMIAEVNGVTVVEDLGFTVDRENGIVMPDNPSIFPKPSQDAEANVVITFSKTIPGAKDKINKCTLLAEFDRRIFFSGNQDYPNGVFHSELNDPRYIRDNAEYPEGLDLAPVKALIPGNDVLWVIKAPNQNKTTVFYHVPTIDYTYGKVYPSYQGNISNGCVSTGVNFNDDIVFFSRRGLEAISGDINSEKLLQIRSSLVNTRLSNETSYNGLKLAEYEGYLMCLVDSKMYIADSRQKFENESTGEVEYEWYYWELPNDITYIKEYSNKLFYGNEIGQIYEAAGTSDNNVPINSYQCTRNENFGIDTLLKTTNKRGGLADVKVVEGGTITVSAKTDQEEAFTVIGTFDVSKGYIVYKIKKKKFNKIQLKFSSSNMGLFSCGIEAFVGSYVKR